MLIAIIVTSLVNFTYQGLKLNLALNSTTMSSKSKNLQHWIYYILPQVYYPFDAMIHTAFVSKYWALSRQLESLLSNKTIDRQNQKIQVCLIFTLQIVLCAIGITMSIVFIEILDSWSVLTVVYFITISLPPFVVCVVLCDALIRIRKCEKRKTFQ